MKLAIASLACALAFAGFSTAASAKDIPAGGVTVNDIASWLQAEGFQAKIGKTSEGKPKIDTSSDGHESHIYFYDCKGDRCGSIEIFIGIDTGGKMTLAKMNQWNMDNRWGRAYLDKVNDPWLEMDMDLTPGGTYELLGDELATYRNTLGRFEDYVRK